MAAIGDNPAALVRAPARHEVGWLRQVWLIYHKDLRVELATGEIVTTSGFFALLIVVIGSLSFYAGPRAETEVAPGVIWVAVAFASVLALSRTWQRERENDALSGLLVGPVKRSAIFAGKALGVATFLFAIQVLVLLGTSVLFSISLSEMGPGLLVLSLCANPGIAAAGTLFGAMTVRTGARDLILASVLFPLLAPTLLAAVAGTRELLDGVPLPLLTDYLQLMAVFAVVFVAGGLSLFGTLIES